MTPMPALQLVLALAGTDVASDAAAPHRIAVLVAAESPEDASLADNLAEVAISQLAERPRTQLLGARELRQFLAGGGGAASCLLEMLCLRASVKQLAVDQIVTGVVRRRVAGFVMGFTLTDVASGATLRHVDRDVAAGDQALQALIEATQEGIDALVLAEPPPPPPPAPPPASAPHGSTLALSAGAPAPADARARRGHWGAPLLVYGSGGLALLAFSAAGVLGTLAEADPTGATRAAAQRDLTTREGYARVANDLWITGGALAIFSGVAFLLLRHDLIGD